MGKMGIIIAVVVIALATNAYGRPSSSAEQQKDDVNIYKKEAKLIQEDRPCLSRFYEVKAEIIEFEEIHTYPYYVPECSEDGKKWRPSQCDHKDGGACFCVHEKNGEIVEGTKRERTLNKEALRCGMRMTKTDHSGSQCFYMQEEFSRMQVDFGLKGHTPLFYYPECTTNGKFMAMQRNDRSMFFCVDTDTGDVIPETETKAASSPPLTEDICQAYDQVWQQFKAWNVTQNPEAVEYNDAVTESSCSAEMTFTECGCPIPCNERASLDQFQEECVCRPACVCPRGLFVLDGRCVNLEQCHEQKPQSTVPHSEKLDDLTAGDFSRWKGFMRKNPNAVLEKYNSLANIIQDGRALYAGGRPAMDFIHNNPFFVREPEEGQRVGFYGGENINNQNSILRRVLSEGGDDEEEEQEEYTGPNEETTESNEGSEILEREPYFQLEPLGYVEEEENVEEEEEFESNEEPYPVFENIDEPVEETEESYPEEQETHFESEYREMENNEPEQEEHELENEAEAEYVPEEEEFEPENEIDDRIVKEEMIEHQTEFSSVPTSETESEELRHSPPCDESPDEQSPPLEPTDTLSSEEEDLDKINRVLSENGVDTAVSATFQKPTTSIKKNTAGR